jgi:hypothetical protein
LTSPRVGATDAVTGEIAVARTATATKQTTIGYLENCSRNATVSRRSEIRTFDAVNVRHNSAEHQAVGRPGDRLLRHQVKAASTSCR